MKIRIILTFIIILILGSSALCSEELKLSTDTNNVSIGDPVNLELSLKTKKLRDYAWPNIDFNANNLELINESEFDTIVQNKVYSISKKYTVTAFDSGAYNLPPQVISYEKEGFDTPLTTSSDSLLLRFERVKVDTTEAIKDIKNIIEVPIYEDYAFWIILALGVLASLILLYYFITKKDKSEKKEDDIDYDPSIPPYILAIESLKRLREDRLWQKGEVKEYYTRLTDILRLYIKRVYNIKTLEMTSDQLIRSLKKDTNLSSELVESIRTILSSADMSKFAKAAPLPDENTKAMDLAINFVESTKIDSEQNGEVENA